MDPKIIEEHKKKYGDLYLVENDSVEVLVRGPTSVEYRVFMGAAVNESKRAFAVHDLAVACVVYPDRKAFESILEKYPAFAEPVGERALELGRGTEEIRSKKV